MLTNPAYTKSRLTKGGTQIDGASLSGISSSVGNIYYNWTSPADVGDGTWVCNFARDIKNNHGGGGNRKVPPTCYQVQDVPPPPPPAAREVFLGYADNEHAGSGGLPSPWAGDTGVVFLGCLPTTGGCIEGYDGGAIQITNPAGNPALTLTNAYVDIGPCHYEPWSAGNTFLPAGLASGGTLILTQTGTLGPPLPEPCSPGAPQQIRDIFNFDTSDGPVVTCDPNHPALPGPPVITLVFSNGTTWTVTDVNKVLNTGGNIVITTTP